MSLVTCQLLEAVHKGILSWEDIGRAALSYMSEYDVADMARGNELLPIIEEEWIDDEDTDTELEDEDEVEEMVEYIKFLEERNSK